MAVTCHVEVGLCRNISPTTCCLPCLHPAHLQQGAFSCCLSCCLRPIPLPPAYPPTMPTLPWVLQLMPMSLNDTPLPNLPPMRPATPQQPLVAQLTSNKACNPTTTCCLPRRPPPAYMIAGDTSPAQPASNEAHYPAATSCSPVTRPITPLPPACPGAHLLIQPASCAGDTSHGWLPPAYMTHLHWRHLSCATCLGARKPKPNPILSLPKQHT